ncbi:MAG: CBS domain-containing protein [Clostridiaceae bacterium]|nr:CBS domain-containing protein [Clostridiaceae bacterium]
MLARDIMTKEVITVHGEDSIEKAIKLLLEHNVSGLPVIDENHKLKGIITEGDLIHRSKKLHIPTYFTILDSYIFLENPKTVEDQIKKMTAYKVEDMMTTKVISVDYEETIEEIATIMANKNINRVPVVKEEKLVGIVSRRDIIKVYAKK